ncbi:MAG TPA: glycosyltransferase family 4 protein [Acidimicrobiia bacterium]|nr:glycosyltransferase family 4 protein [Acidimicrobiia bacterium]
MRIALWTNSYLPTIGGVEVLMHHFVNALVERGHEVLVIASRTDPTHSPRARHGAVDVVRIPFEDTIIARDPGAFLAARGEVSRARAEFRPDVDHLYHGSGGEISFFAMTAGRRTGGYLASLHLSYDDNRVFPNGTLHRVFAGAAAVTTCSEAVRSDLIRQLPDLAATTVAIANSLPWPALDPAPMRFDPPTLFAAGRMTEQKGFDVAIEALARLSSPPRLVIAGAGTEQGALLEKVARLGLDDLVSFPGWMLPDEVPHAMQRATAVLMPSRWEPFGLVALQAAQAGRPVIASRVDGLVEVVVDGETGILVPPGDPDALAEAIDRLVGDHERAINIGRAAGEHARAHFPWDRHVDAYEALLQRAAHAAGPAGPVLI